jgi:hypothetical protein
MMRRSPESSSMTSIEDFSGRPAMTMSLSSMTSIKKRRCVRRRPLTPKPHHLLLINL